jgi:hypothetical protein
LTLPSRFDIRIEVQDFIIKNLMYACAASRWDASLVLAAVSVATIPRFDAIAVANCAIMQTLIKSTMSTKEA